MAASVEGQGTESGDSSNEQTFRAKPVTACKPLYNQSVIIEDSKQKPAPADRNGLLESKLKNLASTLRFDRLFLLGLFRLFLELELVADNL